MKLQKQHRMFDDSARGTWDEEGRLHSFHGQPAYVTNSAIQWRQHGVLHRGGDLPAIYRFNYVAWYVEGEYHRSTGPAEILNRNKSYMLFGYPISKTGFQAVTSHSKSKGFPLWVSWLVYYGLIDDSYFDFMLDETGNWMSDYPSEWLLRAWDIKAEDVDLAFVKHPIHTRLGKGWIDDYRTFGYLEIFNQFPKIIAHLESEEKDRKTI